MWYIVAYEGEDTGYALVQLSKTEFDTIVKYEDSTVPVTRADYCGCTRINRNVAFKTKKEAIAYLIKNGPINLNRDCIYDFNEDNNYNGN